MMRGLFAIALAVLSPFALADESAYFEIGVSELLYQVEGHDERRAAGPRITLGSEVSPYLSVETQFAHGFGVDEFHYVGGFYVRPQLPLPGGVTAYALTGGARANVRLDSGESRKFTGRPLGGGFEWNFSEDASLLVEYVDYMPESNLDARTISIGFRGPLH